MTSGLKLSPSEVDTTDKATTSTNCAATIWANIASGTFRSRSNHRFYIFFPTTKHSENWSVSAQAAECQYFIYLPFSRLLPKISNCARRYIHNIFASYCQLLSLIMTKFSGYIYACHRLRLTTQFCIFCARNSLVHTIRKWLQCCIPRSQCF